MRVRKNSKSFFRKQTQRHSMKSKRPPFHHRIYLFLNRCIFTRSVTQHVRKKYELLCPSQERFIEEKTVTTILVTWLFVFFDILIIFARKPSIYHGCLAVALAVIINYEIIQWNVRSLELKLFVQFHKFLEDVRHFYYVNHMVDEAILDAMEHTKNEMRIQAIKLYEILTSDCMEEQTETYYATTHNKYFHLFLALCVTVAEYGDREVNHQSLFLFNLTNLKTEVHLELLKMKQRNYLYSGLTFVILTPMLLLKGIEAWAMANLPELGSFYHGIVGMVLRIVIVGISLLVYCVVTDLKEFRFYLPNPHRGLEWLLSFRIIREGIRNYERFRATKCKQLRKLLDESGETITLQEFFLQRFLYSGVAFGFSIVVSLYVMYKNKGVLAYNTWPFHRERFDWYELCIALLLAMIGFKLPQIKLMFHRKITQMNKEDEVIRFQSIVLMMMYIEKVNVLEILERVEDFSFIFKKSIQNCINNYNYSDQKALQQLKDEELFEPFQRFVDNLMICDEIGIERAFDEVATDRQYFQEKRKQENEIQLEKKSNVAKFIAYIPAVFVIGGYLILPFLIECFAQLGQYTDMMGSMY